jgi:hypothetical protein
MRIGGPFGTLAVHLLGNDLAHFPLAPEHPIAVGLAGLDLQTRHRLVLAVESTGDETPGQPVALGPGSSQVLSQRCISLWWGRASALHHQRDIRLHPPRL